jgi:hypothetical protein
MTALTLLTAAVPVGKLAQLLSSVGGRQAAARLLATLAEEGGAIAPSTGRSLLPRGANSLGRWGEQRLAADLGGAGFKPRSPFRTSTGYRYVDRMVNGVAHEAKAGVNVRLTSSIRRQIAKDVELTQTRVIRYAKWHFYQGISPELAAYLKSQGIKVVVHG